MPIELIDSHAHLDDEAFDEDRSAVIQRAAEESVSAVITIGTTAASSRRAVELARQHAIVFAAVGIHPNHSAEAQPEDWSIIEELADDPQVVAVGETGLDRYWDFAPLELQAEYFTKHMELARRKDLPFIVHCRHSEEDVVAQLREAAASGPLRGVMHSFCGDWPIARSCLELGMDISFAGMLTFKKSDSLRDVAAEIPADRLLVETDAPYLAPEPKRGKRNEPSYVRHTLQRLAEVRNQPFDVMAQETVANTRRLFALPADG